MLRIHSASVAAILLANTCYVTAAKHFVWRIDALTEAIKVAGSTVQGSYKNLAFSCSFTGLGPVATAFDLVASEILIVDTNPANISMDSITLSNKITVAANLNYTTAAF